MTVGSFSMDTINLLAEKVKKTYHIFINYAIK